MFNRARLKLTLWYLLIIMSISISFSFFIYQLLQNELKRIALVQQERIEHQYDRIIIPGQPGPFPKPVLLTFDQEVLEESQRRLLSILLLVNGSILIISGGLGYLLAGETLKPIQDMVEDQNRFISDASHELRTPLTALKSTLEVHLRDPQLKISEARILIKDSIEEVDKLYSLSEDLLQLARSKHTAQTVTFTRLQLDKVVSQAIGKVKVLATKKQIVLKQEVPAVTIEGQSESLLQVFVIALDNAIKYSPAKSQIEIRGQVMKDRVEVSITDHGVGIARKDMPHIFDRFYRTDSARSKVDAGGYGLGLSIAQQIMTLHRGRIVVRSKPQVGTSLTLIFPRVT